MKKILMVASMVMLGTSGAWALGTEAGTDISNSATLSYSAGGVAQPDVNTTTPDTFKVDKKVDMVLTTTDPDQIEVTPGQTDRITNYEFKNEGNADQKFTFAVSNLSNNEEADYDTDKDNEDTDSMSIEYSTDGGSTWQAYSSAITVAKDATVQLRVKANIKTAANGAADGDIMNVELLATAVKDDGTTAEIESDSEDPTAIDVVLADGVSDTTLGSSDSGKGDAPKDGKEAARSGYIIKTPVLTVTKTSCVYDDPVNGTSTPKRIPGANIMYVMDIENTGSADASNITLKDTLQTELDGGTLKSGKDQTANYATVDENTSSCACSSGSLQSSGSDSEDKDNDPQKVEIQGINVAKAKHTCVSFTVEIK